MYLIVPSIMCTLPSNFTKIYPQLLNISADTQKIRDKLNKTDLISKHYCFACITTKPLLEVAPTILATSYACDLLPWPLNLTWIVSRWTSKPNVYMLFTKLSSAITDTHTLERLLSLDHERGGQWQCSHKVSMQRSSCSHWKPSSCTEFFCRHFHNGGDSDWVKCLQTWSIFSFLDAPPVARTRPMWPT